MPSDGVRQPKDLTGPLFGQRSCFTSFLQRSVKFLLVCCHEKGFGSGSVTVVCISSVSTQGPHLGALCWLPASLALHQIQPLAGYLVKQAG